MPDLILRHASQEEAEEALEESAVLSPRTGRSLIARNAIMTMPDAAALAEREGLTDGQIVQIPGIVTPGDGGEGVFRWILGDTTPADGATVIGAGAGRWHRQIDGAWKLTWFGIAADGVTDDALRINAAIRSLHAAGGGLLELNAPHGAETIYVNAAIALESNIQLVGTVPLLYGPRGRIQVQGRLVEAEGSARIRAPLAVGATEIPLGTQSSGLSFAVGQTLFIRGKNDAAGEALWHDEVTITAVNIGTNTLTVTPALLNAYEISYPDSDWPNDDTIIKKLEKTALTANATAGATTVTVANPSLFPVGTLVTIRDNKMTGDISGTSKNRIHIEVNRVVGVSGSTLTLAMPLAHDYATAFAAFVAAIEAVENCICRDITVTYAAPSENNNMYALATKFAVDSRFERCRVIGNPQTGLGPIAQSLRLGECSWRCAIDRCVVSRPAGFASGQGYGATIYAGARQCTIRDSRFEACRHSVLLFSGVSDNLIRDNVSVDCRGTDFDLHGAEEVDNTFVGNLVVGGPSATDIAIKSAFKVGNTTHRAGAFRNTFSANTVQNHSGYAFHLAPSSNGTVIADNIVKRCFGGVYLQKTSTDLALKIVNTTIEGNTFRETDYAVRADGNDTTNRVVEDLVFSGNIVHDAPGLNQIVDIRYVNGFSGENNSLHSLGAAAGTYMVEMRDTIGVRVANWSLRGGQQGVQAVNLPSAAIDGFTFASLITTKIFNDGNGNTGLSFTNYAALGFTPTFGAGSSSPTVAPAVSGLGVAVIRVMTQAAYDALVTKDSQTLYVING